MRVLSGLTATSLFLGRNAWYAVRLQAFSAVKTEGFVFEPLTARRLADARDLFALLNPEVPLGVGRIALLRLLGPRLCLLVTPIGGGPPIGMSLYYFNRRDRCVRHQRTVHEAYIGLREEERGKGIGTLLRRHALEHFARCGMQRVSSRILASNAPSIKSNVKLGFVSLAAATDRRSGEIQHYMVCDLRGYRKGPGTARADANAKPAAERK